MLEAGIGEEEDGMRISQVGAQKIEGQAQNMETEFFIHFIT